MRHIWRRHYVRRSRDSCDLYWYSNKYELADYLKTVNEAFKDLQIFHTMGNHDNDMNATSDFDAEIRYRTIFLE